MIGTKYSAYLILEFFFFLTNYSKSNKILNASSKPPIIKNKYESPNNMFKFKNTAEFSNKQKIIRIINSLLIRRLIIF